MIALICKPLFFKSRSILKGLLIVIIRYLISKTNKKLILNIYEIKNIGKNSN